MTSYSRFYCYHNRFYRRSHFYRNRSSHSRFYCCRPCRTRFRSRRHKMGPCSSASEAAVSGFYFRYGPSELAARTLGSVAS